MNINTVKILNQRFYVGRTMPLNGDPKGQTKACISAMVLEAHDLFNKALNKQRGIQCSANYSHCIFIYNDDELNVEVRDNRVHVSGYINVRWAYDPITAKGFLFFFPGEQLKDHTNRHLEARENGYN